MQAQSAPISTRCLFFLLSLCLCLGSPSAVAAETNGKLAPRKITAGMTCKNCGMYPERYPKWQTQIILADDSMAAFDGAKCMFRFIFGTKPQVAAIWVRDFQSGKWIDGKTAHYVVGSREMGPMGKELIPFAEQSAASAFQKANGGSLADYPGINATTLQSLMGGMQMGGHGH